MPNWHEWTEQANPRPEARIKVCHKQIACYGPFAAQLKNEFLPFLQRNSGEVITLFLKPTSGVSIFRRFLTLCRNWAMCRLIPLISRLINADDQSNGGP